MMNKSQPSQQKPTNNLNTNSNNNNNNNTSNNQHKNTKPSSNKDKVIWDCGSTLYDSVELHSFRKQIDTAIINSSRTLSMPRLPSQDRRAPSPPPPPQQPQPPNKPPSSKFSRSFQKLLRSVFRSSKSDKSAPGNSSPDPWFFDSSPLSYEGKGAPAAKYVLVYDTPDAEVNGLTTIPEVPEVNFSPEMIGSNLIRKTMSERFTSAAFGIHCA